MAEIYKPRPHQEITYNFGRERDHWAGLLDMGLGKTIVTLTLIKFLLDSCTIHKPLILAPKHVANHTWPEEIEKWKHLKGLTYSVITGDEPTRLAAVRAKADIYIVSYDHIVWLTDLNRKWRYDMVVADESSKLKNQDTKRFKAVRRTLPRLRQFICLTGTPIPNGLMDIWAQMYLLDRGQRLDKFIGPFRQKYFHVARIMRHGEPQYKINHGAEEEIYDKIRDICISMKSVDWLTLPGRQTIIREVELDDYEEYNNFKAEKVLELPDAQITAFNSSSLYMKLLQYANGAIYDTEHKYHVVHDHKLDALVEAVEELQGKPVIIFYQFQSDIKRIMNKIPDVKLFKGDTVKLIKAWNKREVPVMLAHAASAGHGLNLQSGGNYLFFFGVGPNMEWFEQAIKRLDRPGQEEVVMMYLFLTKGTPEHKVYKSLLDKTFNQDKLFAALK